MKPASAMHTERPPQAHVVDDDDALRDALAFLLHSRGVEVTPYASAEAFLAAFHQNMRGCILTDIRMGGMSGLDMFDRLEARQCTLPLIVLTGHGNVAMAVGALKKGVRDFVEKPFNTNSLVDKVIATIADDALAATRWDEKSALVIELGSLSKREHEVIDGVGRQDEQGDRRQARHRNAHGGSPPLPHFHPHGRAQRGRTGQFDEPDERGLTSAQDAALFSGTVPQCT